MELTNYEKIPIKKLPKKITADTNENKFWKSFQITYQHDYEGSIQNVVCNNQKNYIAFSYSNKLLLYNCNKEKIKYEISKNFTSNITSVNCRLDGELIITGENNGNVQVIQTKKYLPLRSFKSHTKPVYSTCFLNKSALLTGGDDKIINLYDMPTNSVIKQFFNAHTDYIRSISAIPLMNDNFLSSSYDGKIQLFNINSQSNKYELQWEHGNQVEQICSMPNGFSFVSIGGTDTKMWDLRNNETPIFSTNNNQKSLTCVRILKDGSRILTASIDQSIKIYNPADFLVVHQYKLQQPIMSFDITEQNSHLAIGMNDGKLLVKKSKKIELKDVEKIEEEQQNQIPFFLRSANQKSKQFKTYKFYNRGIYEIPKQYDFQYLQQKQRKLLPYDKFLKKFQFKNALMAVLKTKQNDVILSLLEELKYRNTLETALKNLDQEEFKLVFNLVIKKLTNPSFFTLLYAVANILFTLYIADDQYNDYFIELEEILNKELIIQKQMNELKGQIETIIACSEQCH